VHEYREGIENLLAPRTEELEEWDVETISSAHGHLSSSDFDINFMLKIFSSNLPHSDTLFKILQTKRYDTAFCSIKIGEFKYHMQKLKGKV
jgi:hypothetical protein